jgi:hypothetical protein
VNAGEKNCELTARRLANWPEQAALFVMLENALRRAGLSQVSVQKESHTAPACRGTRTDFRLLIQQEGGYARHC